MKHYVLKILIVILFCIMLSGCSNQITLEMLKEVKNSTISEEISVNPAGNDFGVPAYKLLEYIQDHYPGRIAGSEKEKEMALFILSALLEGGYQEKDITVQAFDIMGSDRTTDESTENKFDAGQRSNSSQNIEVNKEGESEKIIIVGAHYDSVGTHGVDDNGSGVAVALENALRMVNAQTYYTVRYVFFGSEEMGMHGSSAYVGSLSEKERKNIMLMINMDTILAGDHLYLYGGNKKKQGSPDNFKTVMKAVEIANEIGVEIKFPPKDSVPYPYPPGLSDYVPFRDIGIPYIYFEANNWETGTPVETEKHGLIMHTDKDDLDFIEKANGERAKEMLASYSKLLYEILCEHNWE